MYRRFFGAGLLLAFVTACAVPTNAAPDKQPMDGIDADSLPPGQFTGKLKTPPASDGSFIVSIQYQYLQLKNPNQIPRSTNPQMNNIIRDQVKITQLQNQIASTNNAKKQAQYLAQLQTAMIKLQNDMTLAQLTPQQNPYNVMTGTKDITFHTADEVKVRFSSPPAAFDEKGNVKKYTADELKELKGMGDDAKLPGYQGTVEKLTAGMPVQVKTVANKPKKEEKKPDDKDKKPDDKDKKPDDKDKKPDDKDKKPDDKDAPKDPTEKKDMGPKTVVNLIVVLGDENSGTGGDNTNPKKQKNN